MDIIAMSKLRKLQAQVAKIEAGGPGLGDMTKATYDKNLDGVVDEAAKVDWEGVQNPPDIAGHIASTSNPHGVTAQQAGAEPANANIQGHISQTTGNPHAVTCGQIGAVPTSAVGATVAPLVDGLIPAANLPSYVDDVLEYAGTANFPATGESGKIYVDTDESKSYRWSGTQYIEIVSSGSSGGGVSLGLVIALS